MTNQKKTNDKKDLFSSFKKAFKSFGTSFPLLVGMIFLLGLIRTHVSSQMLCAVFTGEQVRDTLIGSIAGSIFAGNAVNSYIIGGELAKEGVSLIAITAFFVAWVTVGIIQLPAEAAILGRRFACLRNILAFVLSVLVATATVNTLMVIQ